MVHSSLCPLRSKDFITYSKQIGKLLRPVPLLESLRRSRIDRRHRRPSLLETHGPCSSILRPVRCRWDTGSPGSRAGRPARPAPATVSSASLTFGPSRESSSKSGAVSPDFTVETRAWGRGHHRAGQNDDQGGRTRHERASDRERTFPKKHGHMPPPLSWSEPTLRCHLTRSSTRLPRFPPVISEIK